jgi:hypothetical protein
MTSKSSWSETEVIAEQKRRLIKRISSPWFNVPEQKNRLNMSGKSRWFCQEPYIQDQIHRAKSLSLSRIGRGFFQPNHGRCAIQIGNATNFTRIANQIGNGWLGCD